MRSESAARCSSDISRLWNGFVPMRYGHSGQTIVTHFRTSLGCSTQQSRHLARIAASTAALLIPACSYSPTLISRGSRPISSLPSTSKGEISSNRSLALSRSARVQASTGGMRRPVWVTVRPPRSCGPAPRPRGARGVGGPEAASRYERRSSPARSGRCLEEDGQGTKRGRRPS